MKFLLRPVFFLFLLLFILFFGCSPVNSDTPQPFIPSKIDLYRTSTVSVDPTHTPFPVETIVVLPSPTAFAYTVKSGDTISQIAQRYGLTLDEVLAANPGVNSQTLSIGQILQIPSRPASLVDSAPSPAALEIGSVNCFPSGTGMWCLAALRNPHSEPVENITAQISILANPPISQEALIPLNILPAEAVLPIYAFFETRPENPLTTRLDLTTAFLLSSGDPRYLPAKVDNLLVQIAADGLSAQVNGRFFLREENRSASEIWLAGIAYDENNQIVGFRRWQSLSPLAEGQSQTFSFDIYSLNNPVADVEVVIEARP